MTQADAGQGRQGDVQNNVKRLFPSWNHTRDLASHTPKDVCGAQSTTNFVSEPEATTHFIARFLRLRAALLATLEQDQRFALRHSRFSATSIG
jgi:hypothetical protein